MGTCSRGHPWKQEGRPSGKERDNQMPDRPPNPSNFQGRKEVARAIEDDWQRSWDCLLAVITMRYRNRYRPGVSSNMSLGQRRFLFPDSGLEEVIFTDTVPNEGATQWKVPFLSTKRGNDQTFPFGVSETRSPQTTYQAEASNAVSGFESYAQQL